MGRLDKRIKNYSERAQNIRQDDMENYEAVPQPEEYYEEPQEEYYEGQQEEPQQYIRQNVNPFREQQQYMVEEGPLSIIEEIKRLPTPKGTYKTMISGVPVDLHALEEYIPKISPYGLKTLMRYHNARTIEEIRGYTRFGSGKKINMGTIIIIMVMVGMAVLGVCILLFMPSILEMFQGGF